MQQNRNKTNRSSSSNSNLATKSLALLQKKTSKKTLILITVSFCLVFGLIFLYAPAKELYIVSRQHDKLQAQYDTICKTNKDLNEEIQYLQTPEGIKQRANESLGLIESGESTGVVSGLNNSSQADNKSDKSTSSRLAYKNVEAPQTWYSSFCDFIFGVK